MGKEKHAAVQAAIADIPHPVEGLILDSRMANVRFRAVSAEKPDFTVASWLRKHQ